MEPEELETTRAAVEATLGQLDGLIAVYLFGSRASAEALPTSDLDLALLLAPEKALPATLRFELQEVLARTFVRDVDLVDLGSADAVFRVQVIDGGLLLIDRDRRAREYFEAYALSDYARLNEERAGILSDIEARGSVYG